jgi:hypothetical protein
VNISGYPFLGSGVYWSGNEGVTWTYRGLQNTGVLSKVFVDLTNPEMIYVGSMGYPSEKEMKEVCSDQWMEAIHGRRP